MILYCHCEMITTIKLSNIFTVSHSYPLCMWVIEQLRSTLLANFKHSTVLLTTVSMLYVRLLELIHSICKLSWQQSEVFFPCHIITTMSSY